MFFVLFFFIKLEYSDRPNSSKSKGKEYKFISTAIFLISIFYISGGGTPDKRKIKKFILKESQNNNKGSRNREYMVQ